MAVTYKFESNGTFIYKCEKSIFESGDTLFVAANQQAVFIINGKAEAVYAEGDYTFGTDIEITEGTLYIVDSSVTMPADWQTDGAVKAGETEAVLSGEMTVAVSDARLVCQSVEKSGLEALFSGILENDLNTIAKEALETEDFEAYIKEKLSLCFEKVGATLYSLTAKKEIPSKPEKQRNIKKILVTALASVAAVAVVAALVLNLVIPYIRYSGALKAIDNGEYVKAYETLTALGSFSDSEQKLAQIEAPVVKEKINLANEKEFITFGSFEQDGDLSNGAEPLEWMIVKKEDGKALLTTKYAIDARPFNNNSGPYSWESCSLRTWLGNEFMNTAFTEAQQSMLAERQNITCRDNSAAGIDDNYTTTDKVFLLSYNEMYEYLTDMYERMVVATPYAQANGAYIDPETNLCWWWLRSPGTTNEQASYVNLEGFAGYEGDGVANKLICVRPVIYLNIA